MISPVVKQIQDLIEPSLEADGFAVVQVALVGGDTRKTLQIMAENKENGCITVDECTRINRTVSALMDVEEILDGAYNLEVSSPGIDRPLVRAADFEKYLGFEAKIESALPVDGRRRFKGPLIAFKDDVVSIKVDNQDYDVALGNIQSAKLILTDALIKAQTPKQAS